MKSTRLTSAIALTLALGASVLAGEPSRVCNPDPGIMQSPPCAMAQLANDESTTPLDNEAQSSVASGISWSEATIDIVQTLLTIF